MPEEASPSAGFPSPIKAKELEKLIEELFEILEIVAIAAVAFALLYAGYIFLTAGGEPGKLAIAKKAIFWTIVGAAIIFLGEPLVKMIIEIIAQF